MSLLGVRLTLLVGPTVAVPAPPSLVRAIERVEVHHGDDAASRFQITFRAGRSGSLDILDHALLQSPLLAAGNRVVVVVTFNVVPRVLIDGIICHQELAAANEPGASTVTILGDDLTVVMDREAKVVEHPAMDATLAVNRVLAPYLRYGVAPQVIPPSAVDFPNPVDRVPVQRGTDLAYIRKLARRLGYVFYLIPGPAPMTSRAYFGPPVRAGVPQPALSVDLAAETNVAQMSFRFDPGRAAVVTGSVLDPDVGVALPVQTFASTRLPPLALQPALVASRSVVRHAQLASVSGLGYAQAQARAQAHTDASTDGVQTATGELDAVRYGGLLEPRGLVGVRGAGFSNDGFYYVKSVKHVIREGEYRQRFTLTREGLGSTTPVVRP